MLRWTFLGLCAAWAAGMLYEWMWTGGRSPWLLFSLAAGMFVGGVVFSQMRRGKRMPDPKAMVWFILAALSVSMGYGALERTVEKGLSHVPMLPMYFILFLDFFVSGCYTWWKKWKRR